MPLLALYNPISGDGTAEAFFTNHVLPFLSKHRKTIDQTFATQSAGHAGQIITDFLTSRQLQDDEVTIILCSGDGTLHDIINFLQSFAFEEPGAGPVAQLNFVLVPCGTANALFASLFPPVFGIDTVSDVAYKLQSLQAYIEKPASQTIPLNLARTTRTSHPSAKKDPQVIISLVVISTSLHASILHDSEKLRKTMPGIERSVLGFRQIWTTRQR
jgi:diacylglycerol kinase family enzyme